MQNKITLDTIVNKFSSYNKNNDTCVNGDLAQWAVGTLVGNDGTQLSRSDLELHFEQDAVEFVLDCCNMAELAILKAMLSARDNKG